MRWSRADFSKDAVTAARNLIGAVLVHDTAEGRRALRITETEAYGGYWEGKPDDGAHSWKGKTDRTRVIFGEPGHAYVYLIYGMYCCFNIVCAPEGEAGCVLIRSGEPLEGQALMERDRGRARGRLLTAGPGRLTMAMGIDRSFYGADLVSGSLYVESGEAAPIEVSRRKNIDYARFGKEFPWRFTLAGSSWVSR